MCPARAVRTRQYLARYYGTSEADMTPRRTNPTPREQLDEQAAAVYIGMSVFYLRKDRSRGRVRGVTPGPAYLQLGRKIRYLREDLDSWLAARRVDREASRRGDRQQPAA